MRYAEEKILKLSIASIPQLETGRGRSSGWKPAITSVLEAKSLFFFSQYTPEAMVTINDVIYHYVTYMIRVPLNSSIVRSNDQMICYNVNKLAPLKFY